VAKLVWRVKLVAERQPGLTTEVEVARLERDEQAGLADLGLRLSEAKQLTAALQAEMVSTQVAVVGERCRLCVACKCVLTSKGYYPATFRSLYGDVPVRVRRLLACPCRGLETVQNLGVITPLDETDARPNVRLWHAHGEGGRHGPFNQQSMDRPAGTGPGGRDEVAGHDRTGRS